MIMRVRPAEPDDVEALTALARQTYADAFGASMSQADLEAHLDAALSLDAVASMLRDDVILLAEDGGALIGFVQLGDAPAHVSEQPGDQELRRLYVTAHRQRRGSGTALLRAALDHPRAVEAPRIWLDVWVRNEGAQRLYRRHGFEVVGERTFEVASGAPTDVDLIMVRPQREGSR